MSINVSPKPVTSHGAAVVMPPPYGRTAFGEALVGQLDPVISVQFPYNLNAAIVHTKANQSGTTTQANSMAVCSTNSAANSSGEIHSIEHIKYEPGLGVVGRFTGLFTTGVANSTQIIGLGDSGEGFFFGYNGADFGVLHRLGGSPEIRTLTVGTASSTGEDITITLNGDAATDVTVTNTANKTLTANEIASHDYSNVGRGWDAFAVSDTVIFVSWDSSVRTGTYTLSGASTAAGTFAQTVAGVAPTNTWIAQSAWNGHDTFDGTGPTGVTIDPTKGNVFQIEFQYLGFGAVEFFIEEPATGLFHLCHTIKFANTNTEPSLDNPSLEMMMIAENTANTTNMVLKSGSMSAFVQGKKVNDGVNRGLSGVVVLTGVSVETPIHSWRVKEVFQGKLNRTKAKINFVSVSVEHTKPVQIRFYVNQTLTNSAFADVDANTSAVQEDTAASASSGGTFLFSLDLGKAGSETLNLTNDPLVGVFGPGDTITATALPNSGNGAEAGVSYNVTENF